MFVRRLARERLPTDTALNSSGADDTMPLAPPAELDRHFWATVVGYYSQLHPVVSTQRPDNTIDGLAELSKCDAFSDMLIRAATKAPFFDH